MPYKDSSLQREYLRQWVARRRAAWFADKHCARCGSTEDLEIDHIDPASKKRPTDHNIWSWSEERRDAELKKCQVLCHECHDTKSASESSVRQSAIPITHGTYWGYRRGCRCDDCDWAFFVYIPARRKA